jgi:hypothetical protein
MCCGVGASWKVNGVMMRGKAGELLRYESRSGEFQRIEASSGNNAKKHHSFMASC